MRGPTACTSCEREPLRFKKIAFLGSDVGRGASPRDCEDSVQQKQFLVVGLFCTLMAANIGAQSTTDIAVLKGLAPVSVLLHTTEGKAALAANYTATGGIQMGTIRQATLMPFMEQQQQALLHLDIGVLGDHP